MNRRQFAYWIGAGLFSLSERLNAETLDTLAAVVMQCTEKLVDGQASSSRSVGATTRHTLAVVRARDTRRRPWELTGRTRPINRTTGEAYTGRRLPGRKPGARRGAASAKKWSMPPHEFARRGRRRLRRSRPSIAAPATAGPPASGCEACTPKSCDCGCQKSMCPRSA